MEKIQKLREILASSNKICFFGGAGVSTESGIRDFRSADGLYNQKFKYPPETMLSHDFFVTHPMEFFDFYRNQMLATGIEPNDAHYVLAELEREGKLTGIITQNIDGLHQEAGSKKVFELHGSAKRNFCVRCGASFSEKFIRESQGVPCCPCGGIVKPEVVLYGESLYDATVRGAIRAIEEAEVLIVAGTSLTVYPAAALIKYFYGSTIVLINRDETPLDSNAQLVIHDSVGKILRKAYR